LNTLNKLLLGPITVPVIVDDVKNKRQIFLVVFSGAVSFHGVVDQFRHLLDLLNGYLSVAVIIIHGEQPFQLLLIGASRRHGERDHELLEADESVVVVVEGAENVLGYRVLGGEEVSVDAKELLFVHLPVREVLHEFLVPSFDVAFVEVRRVDQVGEFGFRYAAVVSHTDWSIGSFFNS